VHEPFGTLEDAQAAVDAWRREYNTDRPHQSLTMAFPATRFTTAASEVLDLRVPAELDGHPSAPSVPAGPVPGAHAQVSGEEHRPGRAVELDRVVPPSGNLWVGGQQIWLGPALAGHTVRLWAGPDRVQVLIDGFRVKTLPSRLDARELARLSAAGARPAGPPPLPPAAGDVIEVERTVSAAGTIGLGGYQLSVGCPLAGQRVTLRLDGPLAHVLTSGVLTRTIACPVPQASRARLRGARAGSPQPPRLPEPLVVNRRVSVRGAIMVGGQKIQVGLPHARKTAQITVEADTYQITVEPGITVTAARTTSRDIKRHKASHYPPPTTRLEPTE
jgi:hypothetical protein